VAERGKPRPGPAGSRSRMPKPRGAVTVEKVWKAAPPLGGIAWPTADIAAELGVRAGVVLPLLHQLADEGRMQRLHRDGTATLWWRRK
jgi:hypothetical protein